MCNVTGQRSTGASLYILGLLVAGIMFIIVGVEYNKDDTDNGNLKTYFWVYAAFQLVGTLGLILDNGDRFCGSDEFKSVDYFGGLLTVVAGFAWAAFGAGMAHFCEDGLYWVGGAPDTVVDVTAAEERSSMAYLSGVASILYMFGSLFILKKILCCEGFDCDMEFINSVFNMILMIVLTVGWFLFATALEDDIEEGDGDDDRRNWAYMIGAMYIIISFGGVFKVFEICCGKKDDNVEEHTGSYDDEPVNGGYDDQPAPGGYGEETTTGYGQQAPQY